MFKIVSDGNRFKVTEEDTKANEPAPGRALRFLTEVDRQFQQLSEDSASVRTAVSRVRESCKRKHPLLYSLQAFLNPFSNAYKIEKLYRQILQHLPRERTIGHTTVGTEYGRQGAKAYVDSKHGPDGALFLDPPFVDMLCSGGAGARVLDAGCGGGTWTIYAAQNGAEAYGIDIQQDMVDIALQGVRDEGWEERAFIRQGSVAALPYEDEFFDSAISICVGCNLPPEIFEGHFAEFQRTLKPEGRALVAAPTSLDVVFSNGSKSQQEIAQHIQEVLNALPVNPSPEAIRNGLIQLTEVLSATFYVDEKTGRLTLVTPENRPSLKEGRPIWRKLPNVIVPNSYYPEAAYTRAFQQHGLSLEKEHKRRFKNEEERAQHNAEAPPKSSLGEEYVAHPPFVVFEVSKRKASGS